MERIVILSTNNNPDYYAYLPYQVKAWHSYGWKVCVLATHDCDHEAITGYGADFTVFLPEFDGVRPETIAQASRLYATNYLPEDALLMTCDMDLIPLSDYWHPEPANITVYGHDLTDYSYIPMGYAAMTGKKWKEVFQLTGDTAADMQRDFALYSDMVKSLDWEVWWNYDWRLLTDRLKPFDINHIIRGRRISGTFAYGRIDRGDSMQVPPNETLIDMHCENNNTQHPDKLNRFLELYESFHGKV